MPSLWVLGPVISALFAVPYLWLDYRKRSQRKYFPSPPSEPILGHLRLFPQDSPWIKFAEWGKQYGTSQRDKQSATSDNAEGGIMHLSVAGKPIILINDAVGAYNLLDKRGAKYSDRPRSLLVGEMLAIPTLVHVLCL